MSEELTVDVIPIESREQWLALRRQDVTASDIPAVCGLDPHRTALRVYAEKAGLIAPDPENEIMRRGRWFEAAAIEALRELEPTWEVRRAGVYLRDPKLGIGCTPDAVAVDPEREGIGNLQIKTVAIRVFNSQWRDPDDPDRITPPLGYQLQALVEARLLGASWAAVVALVVGEFSADVHICPVELHEGAWERVKAEVGYFRRCLEAGVQPEPRAPDDLDTLRAMFPKPAENVEPLDLTGDNELAAHCAERAALKAQAREIEKRVKEIDTEIIARLRDAPAAQAAGWRITYKLQSRPERVVPAASYRVLRITQDKENANG